MFGSAYLPCQVKALANCFRLMKKQATRRQARPRSTKPKRAKATVIAFHPIETPNLSKNQKVCGETRAAAPPHFKTNVSLMWLPVSDVSTTFCRYHNTTLTHSTGSQMLSQRRPFWVRVVSLKKSTAAK